MTDRSRVVKRPSQACIYEVKPVPSRRRKSSSELTDIDVRVISPHSGDVEGEK
jgi:hypothetical protein